MHVAGGVDVNQESDAGHNQNHQAGEMIQQESEIGVKRAGLNPNEVVADNRHGRFRRAKHLQECAERNHERQRDGSGSDDANDGFGQTSSEDAIDDGAQKRRNWNKPEPARKIHLPFQQIASVDIQRLSIAEHRNDQSQTHGGFRCRNDKHKENKYLAADQSVLAGKRHERQVHGVQHDFHRQQQRDDVAFEKEAQHSDEEQYGGQNEIPVQWNHRSFLANTTAPINAININSDVSSNGSR